MAYAIYTKDPNEVLDFSIDWTTWLSSDTISTSTWVVPDGVTKDSDTNTSTSTTIWLSGGTDGDDYTLLNRIVTAGGRTEERTILILCRTTEGYTIGGRGVVWLIRFHIDDLSTPYTYDAETINALIQWAARDFYSQNRPFIRDSTLSISEDVDLYALPSDCVRLIECEYRTMEEADDETLDQQYPWLYEDWEWPSLTMIRNELIARYDELGKGVWEQINCPSYATGGQYVILYPPPEEDDTIDIRYTTARTRTGNDYNIPADHADIIVDWVVGQILHRKATQIQQGFVDIRAGQTRQRYDPTALRQEANRRLQAAIRALSSPIIRRGRSGEP